ncbi:uncharacterized protein LOC106717244 isoform X1 [Papilio machaon]|uniref:uncharacterized protein LOC106717244 isoform X1 n=1 Tax=Papilio machaon TaxID=76193 RepID=UPI001E663217|nr:uncharacterized protein LOC106717244 isoform X1 [Papilio machaon]
MTTQEVDDEHPQSIIKNEDEEISEKPVQKMKPPLDTKVPKSSKVLTKKIKSNNPLTCNICQKTFNSSQPLRFHIRQMYFNLKAKTLLHEMKKVKQVWVEKVLNSNDLIEITKTGPNTLLMKKTERNAIVEPNVEIKEIDLSYLYPTYNKYHYKECTICEVKVPRKRYKKHIVSHMI